VRRLIFIRHCESEHHVNGLTGGWTDTPLTRVGEQQARAVADSLLNKVDAASTILYSSDLERARMTATEIGGRLAIPVILSAALRELNNGDAKDLTREAASRIELPRVEPARQRWRPYANGETWQEMTLRVQREMDTIDSRTDTTAIVVSHGNAGNAIVEWWLRLPETACDGLSFQLNAGSITEGEIDEWGQRSLVRLNDRAHLP
jgi:probable phosphoglycerate mutase